MKIRVEDLRMLMDYLEKEYVETTDLNLGDDKFSVSFKFMDEEKRECQVIIYQDVRELKPDLIKKMTLNTRFKNEPK